MAAMRIKQGDAYEVPVKVTANGVALSPEEIEAAEFMLGTVRKVYPESASYDEELGVFRVPLTQGDTFSLPADEGVQFDVRVKFKGGAVVGTKTVTIIVTVDALSETEI